VEEILKKTTILLAIAGLLAVGSSYVRAEEEDTPYVAPYGSPPPQVEMPPVTVICGAVCKAMMGIPPTLNATEVYVLGPGGGALNAGGGGNAPPPPPPPSPPPPPPPAPPPPTFKDCMGNCDYTRTYDNNNCQIDTAKLEKSLEDRAVLAQRAKMGARLLPGMPVGLDAVPDAVLADIDRQVKAFSRFCGGIAAASQNACYDKCKKQFGMALALPLLIVPVRRKNKKND
jgi:hypothetical protein